MVNWPFLLPSDFVPWLVHLFLGMLQLFPKPVVEDVEISIKIFQQYCIYILRCVYRQFRRGLCLVRAIFMPWWGISMNYHLIGKVWYVTSLIIQTMTVETGETPLAAHFIDSWWCFSRFFFHVSSPIPLQCASLYLGQLTEPLLDRGDEIDALNDSWMFLIWVSDHSPYRTNSVCSRWPIAVLPASLYLVDTDTGVNQTIAAATREIMLSFNKLSEEGIKLREFRSLGGHPVPMTWFNNSCRWWFQTVWIFTPKSENYQKYFWNGLKPCDCFYEVFLSSK